jgi:hypothetical protein
MTEQTNLPAVPDQLDFLDNYAATYSTSRAAAYLRFNAKEGRWLAGADNEEVMAGLHLVALVPHVRVGRVWFPGKGAAPEKELAPASSGKTFETDDDWKAYRELDLYDVGDGAQYIFSASAVGAVNAVDRLVEISSLEGIAQALQARGIPTARGGRWRAQTVRNVMLRKGVD